MSDDEDGFMEHVEALRREDDLTDEELAEMEQWCDGPFYGWRIARLIAALRASRAEVAELEAEVDRCHEEHCG